jgi:hypothetical protein
MKNRPCRIISHNIIIIIHINFSGAKHKEWGNGMISSKKKEKKTTGIIANIQ